MDTTNGKILTIDEVNRIKGEMKMSDSEVEKRFVEVKSLTPKQEKIMKVGRNDLCPCGSGKKFKKCHLID